MVNHTQLLEDSERGSSLRQSMKRTWQLCTVMLTLGCWFASGLMWKIEGFRADDIAMLFAPLGFWWVANLLIRGLDESIGKSKWRAYWPFRPR